LNQLGEDLTLVRCAPLADAEDVSVGAASTVAATSATTKGVNFIAASLSG
jgi:hypothetical protein